VGSCTLLEAGTRWGGKILTEQIDGFVIEGGPDAFLGTKPWGIALSHALQLTGRIVQSNPVTRRAYEWRDGALHALPSTATPPMLSFAHGMQELTDTLYRELTSDTTVPVRCCTQSPVASIALRHEEGMIERMQYALQIQGQNASSPLVADALILAIPAYAAATLLRPVDDQLAALLESISYDDISTMSVAYREYDVAVPLDGHGYLIPPTPETPLTGCTWVSSKFPSRVPPGYVLFRGYVRDTGAWCAPDDQTALLALLRAELRRTLGITAQPVLERVHRWPRALPRYDTQHERILAAAHKRLQRLPGLVLAGSGYHGVGISDCIRDGQAAARAAWSTVAALT
jgi:oxygen-dependent protoporphyrinogen oxidase